MFKLACKRWPSRKPGTARDDSVGAPVTSWGGHTGIIGNKSYANPAIRAQNVLTLSYCRFSYAYVAMECDVYNFATVLAQHSQFVNCVLGVSIIDYRGG